MLESSCKGMDWIIRGKVEGGTQGRSHKEGKTVKAGLTPIGHAGPTPSSGHLDDLVLMLGLSGVRRDRWRRRCIMLICSTSFIAGYPSVTGHLASLLRRLILISNGNVVVPCYFQYYTFRGEQGRVRACWCSHYHEQTTGQSYHRAKPLTPSLLMGVILLVLQ